MDPGHHQVTMGPWVHGCRMNASAHSPSTKPAFDVFEDVARFWDAHLKADPEEGTCVSLVGCVCVSLLTD